MKKKLMIIIMIFGFIFFSGNLIFAQNLFFGGQFGLSVQKPSLDEIEVSTDTTYLYGLYAGVKFAGLALELNYFQAAHDLELKELIDPWADREMDYSFVGVNLKVFIPVPIISPYLTGGYGNYRAEISGISSDSSGGLNIGAGVEMALGDHFALKGEGKYNHVNLNIEERELSVGDFTFAVGIIYYLF